MGKKKNEKYYQKQFLTYLKKSSSYTFLDNSEFVDEFKLFYDMTKTRMTKNTVMPDYSIDFIEIDVDGCIHLWEAKMLDSQELIRGKVIGQMYFYHFLMRSNNLSKTINMFRAKGVTEEKLNLLKLNGIVIKSWNILVCGGSGWELCAGVNPIMWTYNDFSQDSDGSGLPPTSVYHFYNVNDGYDLKHLYHLSIFYPEFLHPTAYSRLLTAHLKMDKGEWEALIKREGIWLESTSEKTKGNSWYSLIGRKNSNSNSDA